MGINLPPPKPQKIKNKKPYKLYHVIGRAFDSHPKAVSLTWYLEFASGLPLGGQLDAN